jgi:hypothetical protein
LATCHDPDLLAYLSSRSVSVSFLVEIDQFLQGHPELASYSQGVEMLHLMNTMAPLEAYRNFLKGYTRPARYSAAMIVMGDSRLPKGFEPPSISSRPDSELDEFFHGFKYRWDILDRIDCEVLIGCANISAGLFVKASMRRLIYYALFGNPIDAYSMLHLRVTDNVISTLSIVDVY